MRVYPSTLDTTPLSASKYSPVPVRLCGRNRRGHARFPLARAASELLDLPCGHMRVAGRARDSLEEKLSRCCQRDLEQGHSLGAADAATLRGCITAFCCRVGVIPGEKAVTQKNSRRIQWRGAGKHTCFKQVLFYDLLLCEMF